MSTWRELCRELIDNRGPDYYRTLERARKALAAGPAVPEGMEPSDEDIMEMMSEEMRADLAAAACAMAEKSGSDSPRVQDLHRIILNRQAVDLARAVLARWGRPTTPPTPAEGEVGELVSDLRRICFDVAPCDSDTITRAADLLERQSVAEESSVTAPVPVAVSERLPQPEDCDAEGRCWLLTVEDEYPQWRLHSVEGNQPGGETLIWVPVDSTPGVMIDCFYASHWLPAHALPLPNGEMES